MGEAFIKRERERERENVCIVDAEKRLCEDADCNRQRDSLFACCVEDP